MHILAKFEKSRSDQRVSSSVTCESNHDMHRFKWDSHIWPISCRPTVEATRSVVGCFYSDSGFLCNEEMSTHETFYTVKIFVDDLMI